MREIRRPMSLLAGAVLAGLMVLAGCSSDGSTPTAASPDTEQNYDLNDPFGGLDTQDEAVAFGDSELLASVGEEAEYDDVVSDLTDVRAIVENPATTVYAVTILWGMLQDESADVGSLARDGEAYDWSGSLVLDDSGALLVRSVVSFEKGDRLVLPRLDRRTLSWESHTGVGYDGIRFIVYQPPYTLETGPDTLTFATGLYTRSIAVTDLDGMDDLVKVDDNGNQVRIQSFLVDPAADVRGYLHGRWDAVRDGEKIGRFRGLWVSELGHVAGWVRGFYGVNDAGEKVFFGKYIDRTGRFRGIVRGHWNRVDGDIAAGVEEGWFRGAWLGESRAEQGLVRGRWRTAAGRPGFFSGNWCLGCPVSDGLAGN